jgi:cytochrome c biogenesis protein CcdA/thiol-disulfide isomerase/thioredoxin
VVLLVLFAVVAGAGTAVSPCVLPVLPAVLSAGAAGGRRRPLGVVLGLAATFTFAVVALASVVKGVGVAGDAARWLAIVVLGGAGLALLIPPLGDRVEAAVSRLTSRVPVPARGKGGGGFASGLLLGGALGFVYAPCAGPILAAVISVSATAGTSAQLVAVALGYAAGSAIVLLLLALGGRRLATAIRNAGRGPALSRALGAILLLTGVAMATRLDVHLEETLARHAPAALVNPTAAFERSGAVQRRLADLRGPARFAETPAGPRADLTDRGPAPEFRGTEHWWNTPGDEPLTLHGLRGRVVLVDFWTYTCINCLRTLPYLEALDERYRKAGLTVVGVHTPEFSFEHEASNVDAAIRSDGIHYPVAQDNAYDTWTAWGNEYWPAEYLVDAHGRVRRAHFGEGDYAAGEQAVRALLREAGATHLPPPTSVDVPKPSADLATPETYLGALRAQGWLRAPELGTHAYAPPAGRLPLSKFAYGGTWKITGEDATPTEPGARIDTTFQAQKVYLVLSSAGGAPRRVGVRVDGEPTRATTVTGQRLYTLVSLPRPGRHTLEVRVPPGVTGYAFTFG